MWELVISAEREQRNLGVRNLKFSQRWITYCYLLGCDSLYSVVWLPTFQRSVRIIIIIIIIINNNIAFYGSSCAL